MRSSRATLLLAIGLLGAVGGSTSAEGQPPSVTVEEFSLRLEGAIELAQLGSSAPSPSRMRQMYRTLELPTAVRFFGRTVLLPHDPFLRGLSGNDAHDFDRAGAHLRWLRAQIHIAENRGAADSHAVEGALDRAYRQVIQIRPNLVERIRRAVRELIAAILYRVTHFVGPSSLLAWSLLLALAAAAALLLRRAKLFPETVIAGQSGQPSPEASVDWSRRAEEALRAGDLVQAVRALYMALLGTLSKRGIVAEAPALTAGECRTAVGRVRPGLYPLLARATQLYERVVYGNATPSEQDVETLLQAGAMARTA